MSTTRLFLELVNLFSPLKYLQIEKKKKNNVTIRHGNLCKNFLW